MNFPVGADANRDGRSNQVSACDAQGRGGRSLLRLLIPGVMAPLLCLAACKTPVEEAASYAQQAQQLFDAGDRLGAVKAIQKAISVRDDNADYFLLLSAIEMRSGNPVDAFLAARRALELDSANVTALTIVANVGLQVGQIDEAAAAADQILSLDPGSLTGLQVKGLVALYRNRDAEAEAFAQRLLAISPTDEAGTIIRVRVLAKAQKFDEALGLIDQSIQQGRTTPALLITKINLFRVLQRPDDMLRTFDQLQTLVSEPPPALQLDRINLLYKLGRRDAARVATAKLLASGAPGMRDFATLQRIWTEFDPVPFTRETIKQARNWPDPVTLLSVGRYLLWQGEPQLADDLYFAFRKGARPVGASLHERAWYALGHRDQAHRAITNILARDPNDADGLLLRAVLESQAGNMGLAVEAAQKALESDPNNPEFYVELANIHARAGSPWRASQVFEDGLKQMPQNFLLIERYTQFLHESGNKSRAVSVSRAFARTLPSSVRAWTIMAQQCAWAGDPVCAAEAAAGRQSAATSYKVDDPPGAPKDRGLLGEF